MERAESTLTALVMVSVLDVCRYLGDVTNIVHSLPQVRSVLPRGEEMLVGYELPDGKTRTSLSKAACRTSEHGRLISWRLDTGPLYSGAFTIYGDCSVTQLDSTLRLDAVPAPSGQHVAMIERLLSRLRAELRSTAALVGDRPRVAG